MIDWTIVTSIVVGLSLFKIGTALGDYIYFILKRRSKEKEEI